jgi:hypothetical protein
MVLGETFFATDTTQTTSSTANCLQLPWGILQSGFTESNILVWPYNFQRCSLDLRLTQVAPMRTFEIAHLRKAHHETIQSSHLKVILLCGKNAEIVALPETQLVKSIEVELRGYRFKGYVETDGLNIRRLYLCSPAPLSSLWQDKWSGSIQLGEIFRFAAAISTTPISPWFYSTAIILIAIYRRRSREQKGLCAKMTWQTIDPQTRAWLHRK